MGAFIVIGQKLAISTVDSVRDGAGYVVPYC